MSAAAENPDAEPVLAITTFSDFSALTKREEWISLEALRSRILAATAPEKARLPWLKMARFGTKRTDKGSLRHDGNMLGITGIEADYDGGVVTFDEAVETVTKAGLSALVYTSPSHTADVPRWRVLAPISVEAVPGRRDAMMGRLNGLFRGILAGESWTLSQSYYYGSVANNPAHQATIIDGTPIDQLDELDAVWMGKTVGQANRKQQDHTGRGQKLYRNNLTGIDESELLQRLISGEAIHTSLMVLLGRWVRMGVTREEATARIRSALEEVIPEDRDSRWHARYNEIDRCVEYVISRDHERRAADGEFSQNHANDSGSNGPDDDSYRESFGRTDKPKPPEQDEKPNLSFDDASWVEADIPKRPWIAPGYALRGSTTIIAGVPAGGKSSKAVSWATALALGVPFGKFKPVQACRVMTFNTEDDADEQRRRFSASARQFGCTTSDLAGKLMRVGVEQIGTLFGERYTEKGEPMGFGPLPAMAELRAKIEEFKPDVIFLDPLVELHDREENDNGQLRLVIALFRALARKYDVAIVLLHHVRKGSGSAAGDMDSIRGGSAIVAACRVAFTITKMSEEDAKSFGIPDANRRHYVRLDEAKSNYGEVAVEWFEKIAHVLDNGDAAMAFAPWTPPVDVVGLETKLAIVADVEAGSAEGPWSTKLGSDARSIRQLFNRHGVTTRDGQTGLLNELQTSLGFTVQSFRKAKNRAKAQGLRATNGEPSNVQWVSPDED